MDNKKLNHHDVWNVVYKRLEKGLSSHAINAWIEPIECKKIEDETLYLMVPNQFFLEWIESHYKNIFDLAFNKEIKGRSFKYHLVINKKEHNKEKDILIDTFNKGATLKNKTTNLNRQYKFDNFIVGSNNEFAKAASESVSKNPGVNNFNPLIIYGGVGLGKTHLKLGNKEKAYDLFNRGILLDRPFKREEKLFQELSNIVKKNN